MHPRPQLIREYCAAHELPYEECGKLVVAADADEVGPTRRARGARAGANGVPGLRRVGPAEHRARSSRTPPAWPRCTRRRTAITDYPRSPGRFAADIEAAGGEVRLRYGRDPGRVGHGGHPSDVTAGVRAGAVDRLVVCAGFTPIRCRALATATPRRRGSCRSAAST